MDSVDRRNFIALASITPLAAAASLRFFSETDARWVETIMAHIIPADDAPGAREAGCLYYLDRQLGEALHRFGAAYRSGLARFQQRHPDFLNQSAEAQLATLRSLERDSFFEMLIDHTMQGFYGSPVHGGNRDGASWQMLGIAAHMGEGHWHGA